ncbi:MAG: hypothetical protein IPK72_15815 [Candidatus Eisenbacteria bacterium]|nr:hypothetical protein [Candidatus Eisenbacteria bacterium]
MKTSLLSRLTPWLGGALVAAAIMASIDLNRGALADQPLMHRAHVTLTEAKAQLLAATPDKGGHRAKALKHLEKAISEVEKGIEFDRKH